MADENTEQTEKLEELFDAEKTDAAAGAARAETGAAHADGSVGGTLPEAEPPWLAGRGIAAPERTSPRVRWAGIIWGLVFAAAGGFALWTLVAPERRAAFSDWVLTLDNGGWAVAAAFALGALLLLLGLIQGLKAASRHAGR